MVEGQEAEITVWSVNARAEVAPPDPVAAVPDAGAAPVAGERALFDQAHGARTRAAEVRRDAMDPGRSVAGPAVVVEDETTVVVPEGWQVAALGDGTLELRADATG